MFATAAAGALILPSLIQLVLIGGGLWLGAVLAQQVFYGGGSGGPTDTIDPNSTIDVEARTIDDDWRDEMFKWVGVGRAPACLEVGTASV